MRNLVVLAAGQSPATWAPTLAAITGFTVLGISSSKNAVALDSGADSNTGARSAAGLDAALAAYPGVVVSWNYGESLPLPADLGALPVTAHVVASLTQPLAGGVPLWAYLVGALVLVGGVALALKRRRRRPAP